LVTPLQLSRLVADAAADKKARGVVRLDIRNKSSIADYFVIAEGDTDRQVRAISDAIVEKLRAAGVRPLHTSGYEEGSWVVLDYAAVIVHVFLPGERSYYDLESLWKGPARTATGNGEKRKAPSKRRVAAADAHPRTRRASIPRISRQGGR
jgi:ribosome-associated protein